MSEPEQEEWIYFTNSPFFRWVGLGMLCACIPSGANNPTHRSAGWGGVRHAESQGERLLLLLLFFLHGIKGHHLSIHPAPAHQPRALHVHALVMGYKEELWKFSRLNLMTIAPSFSSRLFPPAHLIVVPHLDKESTPSCNITHQYSIRSHLSEIPRTSDCSPKTSLLQSVPPVWKVRIHELHLSRGRNVICISLISIEWIYPCSCHLFASMMMSTKFKS